MDPSEFREKYPPEIRYWWENTLKSPKYVVAPMVDGSELAWRMLSRRYKAELCCTPMLHSRIFTEDPKYRTENLFNCVCPEDRPLLVQFCGNDPNVVVEAAKLAKPFCDGIDLNLGCPQKIARNGRYGAFLMDEWELISTIVKRVRSEVQVPISCKIRIFPDVEKTIRYAKMLESSGCYMLTVHGRTREQKGMDTGLADWSYIRAVRNAVNIPVLANGNIQYLQDVERCIMETRVEGVMSAEGNLHNPALFAGESPPVWKMGLEYLELVEKYPCPLSYSRGHLFKLYNHLFSLPDNCDVRKIVAKAECFNDLMNATLLLKERYEPYFTGEKIWIQPEHSNPGMAKLAHPHFICQPYIRPPKKAHLYEDDTYEFFKNEQLVEEEEEEEKTQSGKRRKLTIPESLQAKLDPSITYSIKKLKKMAKNPKKDWEAKREPVIICIKCGQNPKGQKCEFQTCRPCCKSKCYNEELDCVGHKIMIKTVRIKARERDALKINSTETIDDAIDTEKVASVES